MLDTKKDYKNFSELIADLDFDKTSWFIIMHNLMPIIGVIFFNFNPSSIIFIYITETIVIGILTVPKILMAQKNMDAKSTNAGPGSMFGRIFIACFFMVHFNAFNFGQIVFVIPEILGSNEGAFNSFTGYIMENEFMHYAILSIFLSHGLSLYFDYIKPKVYKNASPVAVMFMPYPRIFIQQFVAIFGSFLLMAFGSPLLLLLLLQVLKTAVEIFTHQVLKNASNRDMLMNMESNV